MTRKFLDEVRLANNTYVGFQKGTLGNDMNELLGDMMDSLTNDECAIKGEFTTGSIATDNVNWTKIVDGYQTNAGGDGVFLKPDFSQGEVEGSTQAGFTYEVIGSVSIEGDTNDPHDICILLNDTTPISIVTSETGEGPNDPVTLFTGVSVNSAVSDARYSIGIRTPASNSIVVRSIRMLVTVKPTNNP